MLACWRVGVLVRWLVGVLACWRVGVCVEQQQQARAQVQAQVQAQMRGASAGTSTSANASESAILQYDTLGVNSETFLQILSFKNKNFDNFHKFLRRTNEPFLYQSSLFFVLVLIKRSLKISTSFSTKFLY